LYEMLKEEDKFMPTDKVQPDIRENNPLPRNISSNIVKPSVMEEKKVSFPEEKKVEGKSIKSGIFSSKPKKEKITQNVDVFAAESDEPSLENSDEAVIDALFGDKKGKSIKPEKKEKTGLGLFGGKKKNNNITPPPQPTAPSYQPPKTVDPPLPYYPSFNNDIGFGDNSMDDETVILGNDSALLRSYLELIDSVVPGALPYISLDFDTQYITIGRTSSDEIQPDVAFSRDFKQMGRRHARIEKGNGKYYVIDLGSANHTILNGIVLVPNQMYELTDGGELVLTDSKPVRYRIHL
ncbi:MAG: FHA domain-containing protein, partial [Alistipes sp.]|nr:FHA domain-containing protein [Alistipes sp.]